MVKPGSQGLGREGQSKPALLRRNAPSLTTNAAHPASDAEVGEHTAGVGPARRDLEERIVATKHLGRNGPDGGCAVAQLVV